MRQTFKVTPSVFVAVIKDGKVLLLKRKNTGFMDGYYDLPSGHVEEGEPILKAAARELAEETSLKVGQDDLKLIHVGQSSFTPGYPYMYFMFRALRWQGKPKNNEPEMSDDVSFFALDKLPKTVPHILPALQNLDADTVTFNVIKLTEAEFLGQ
jgi:8-oxo-dGTP diphosphatase